MVFTSRATRKNGEDFILVNGFHPAQLFHFTNETHRIVLVLVHSDTPWGTLRNEMVGATFPEKAVPNSIRGTLYANPNDYGLESVSIANNGVHLSAGPFEGLFEIRNFFGHILDLDVEKQPPLILKKMLAAGFRWRTRSSHWRIPSSQSHPNPPTYSRRRKMWIPTTPLRSGKKL